MCAEYREACILEASGIFLVGVAMCIHAVEHYKGAFQSSPLLPEASAVCSSAVIIYSC